ncbi:uncharacterized protein LOC110406612 [Numida meleagris]|uniref:uncharacterized protein LOC110406612 n=1 Tax=Numida meleagris TaxID=8996 RepID=UPI000B3DE5B7|nr:uncharacterized protein LOC110406612 [Numida meleagris]
MEVSASSAGPAPSQSLALVPYRGGQSWPWDGAWVREELRALPDPIPVQPDACELPVSILVPEAVDAIEAFVQSAEKPQDKEQRMEFLQSICTVCNTAAERNLPCGLSAFCCRNKLAENITELLVEENRGKLSLELWQLVMAAITALSAVKAALEDRMRLFVVCFQSILFPWWQDLNTNLYIEALRALDQMLHTLVFVHPVASIGEELQGLFQVLLPFTCSQNAVARHGAVSWIWKLSQSLAHFCQGRLSGFSGLSRSVRFQALHVPVLGELVGKLVLCCADPEKKLRFHALRALHQLYSFVLERARKTTAADHLRPSQTSHGAERGRRGVSCRCKRRSNGTLWGFFFGGELPPTAPRSGLVGGQLSRSPHAAHISCPLWFVLVSRLGSAVGGAGEIQGVAS